MGTASAMAARFAASGTVDESPLILLDVVTNEGARGHGIVFTYNAAALKPTADLVMNLAPLLEGEELAPAALQAKLAGQFRLLGTQGLLGMALAGIDMALWDALARTHNISLLTLLGGARHPYRPTGLLGMTVRNSQPQSQKVGRVADSKL